MALDASVRQDVQLELDRVALDLRRLQSMDMDETIKVMVRMLLKMVRHLKVVIAKQRS